LRTRAENFSGEGSMCGSGARGVGDLVDVEEHRAGNVLVGELGLGIALLRRQKNEPSTMRMSGASRWAASHSVLTRASGRA
jgi:hypothetical protein